MAERSHTTGQPQTVDWHQVRTLLRASLRMDWRGANNPWDFSGSKKSSFPPMLVVLLVNVMFSIMISLLALLPDKPGAIVLGATAAMLFVAFQVLLEFSNILISPDDYHVIAPHPVSSRTFWLAKMLHLLTYVAILTASLSLIPTLVMLFAGGFGHTVLLVASYSAACLFGAVVVMNLYTLLMNTFGRGRMERILGYVQLVFMLLAYGAYFAFTDKLRDVLEGLDLGSAWWMRLLPPDWFMGWYRLATGRADAVDIVLAIGATLGFGLLIRLGMANLSLGYAESLSEQNTTPEKSAIRSSGGAPRTPWVQRLVGTTRPEDRAVLLLTWSHFKHDIKFRLAILSAIPLVILYLFLGWKDGMQIPDPFTIAAAESTRSNFFIVLAFAIMPMIFQGAVGFSSHAAASWVFHTTPCDRRQLMLAGKRIVQTVFMAPAMVMVIGIYWWAFDHLVHALMHAALLYAIVLTVLTLINLAAAGLPFSAEKNASGSSGRNVASFFLAIVPVIPFAIVSAIGYGNYIVWTIMLGMMLLINYLLTGWQNRRLARTLYELEFLRQM